MDVPATRLRRPKRKVKVGLDSRHEYVRGVAPDPRAACQTCGEGGGALAVLEVVIDRSNGQRITVAICRECARRAVEVSEPLRFLREGDPVSAMFDAGWRVGTFVRWDYDGGVGVVVFDGVEYTVGRSNLRVAK